MALSFIGTALAATEHAGGGEHAAGGAFPPFDTTTFAGQLFWLVIVFALLYWLMSKVALPRVAGIIEDRQARIARDLDEAAQAQKAAEEATQAYEASLVQARTNAQAIGQKAREESAKKSDARRTSVEAELAGKVAAAEKSIAATKAKAMANVGDIAKSTASAIVEKLIGTQPSAKAVADALASAGRK